MYWNVKSVINRETNTFSSWELKKQTKTKTKSEDPAEKLTPHTSMNACKSIGHLHDTYADRDNI